MAINSPREPDTRAEAQAVGFLTREVPAWSREHGCFSCHNNGDAARALYAASRNGHRVPPSVLADTTAWVTQPARWEHNKGDPGFSDLRLANVQFAGALLAAYESGHVRDRQPLRDAARKIAADQAADGAWPIEPGTSIGSPATYGTLLATHMALRTLERAGAPETSEAIRTAKGWLRNAKPDNIPATAALLWALANDSDQSAQPRREQCLRSIREAQSRRGGWGPYADAPPEIFDTALVLLALAELRGASGTSEMIQRGRNFLIAQQDSDGGWPATTRPSGGDSYAQRISTTGWATLALLATRERR